MELRSRINTLKAFENAPFPGTMFPKFYGSKLSMGGITTLNYRYFQNEDKWRHTTCVLIPTIPSGLLFHWLRFVPEKVLLTETETTKTCAFYHNLLCNCATAIVKPYPIQEIYNKYLMIPRAICKILDHVTVLFIALGLRPSGNKLQVTWSNILHIACWESLNIWYIIIHYIEGQYTAGNKKNYCPLMLKIHWRAIYCRQ